MNFIPCLTWVAKGIAKTLPDKLQLSSDELKKLVNETKESDDQSDTDNDHEDDNNSEFTDSDKDDDIDEEETSSSLRNLNEANNPKQCVDSEEDEELNLKYNLDNYDDEDDDRPFIKISDVAVHVDNKDDTYITNYAAVQEEDKEEEEDFTIKSTDNLLIVGHVEDNTSILEIHVYNKDNDDFYVHHDIILPSFPLAVEWLDFDPSEEKPGNFIAIGDMSPVIKIYDLDIVDVLEPDYSLGEEEKKKSKKMKLEFHSDAVISLSWNKHIRNILASGSADSSIILWDLQEGTTIKKLEFHTGKVQSLAWHPFENSFLLSGCTDGLIRVYDCRSDDSGVKSWDIESETERVCWNLLDSLKFFCSNDDGFLFCIDMKSENIETSTKAHSGSVTALDICPERPNILLTASMDKSIKLWNIEEGLQFLTNVKLKQGSIYTVKFAPDCGLIAAVGGNNASNNLKIIDLSEKLDGDPKEEENNSKDLLVDIKPAKRLLTPSSHLNGNLKKKKKHKSFVE